MTRISALIVVGAASVTGCEVGNVDVIIGADVPSTFYVSPNGDDRAAGSIRDPWKTLAHAVPRLRPGHTLILKNGEYRPETTGLLSVDCAANSRQGRRGEPITVRAETERGATLRGDGAVVPLELSGCSYWSVEGLVLTNEHSADVPMGVDVGTVAMIRRSADITLRRSILQRSNRERHSHILRIIESERVLVEENEAYDFYHNAFEAVRSSGVIFRRNYLHSRYAVSQGNTVGNDDPTRGEIAIQSEESSATLFENNVAEVVATGYSVVGRAVGSSFTDPSPYPVSGARLYGNLVRDALGPAFKVETRCDAASPCSALPERIVTDTLIVHGVALTASSAVSIDAAPGTRVDNLTGVDVRDGVVITRGTGNLDLDFSAGAARSVVRDFTGVAFLASAPSDWSFEHCGAQGSGPDAVEFSPLDERVRLPVTAFGADPCVAYLGVDSELRGAAGVEGDVGAGVVRRSYGGVLSDEPLWDPATGAFPCGAIVAGINDDPSQSCSGVHERFRVGSGGCGLPAP